MTYEEAVEDFKKTKEYLEKAKGTVAELQFDNIDENIEQIKIAIEALEKAEKYRWHDLRKNPDDLPEFGKQIMAYGLNFHNVLCKYVEFTNPKGDIEKCFVRFDAWSGNEKLENVIAWRYIELEPFEEEE